MSIAPCQAQTEVGSAQGGYGKNRHTIPLYVVCSPRRGVGKTLLARLLTEFYLIDGRSVAAFDLADEEPQLSDYLPRCTTIANISDTLGQMAFFDRIIAEQQATNTIDVSYRAFKDFFVVVQKVGFFEEARRRSIQPLILFMIDPSPRLAEAYSILRRRFTDAYLLPIRNQIVAKGIPYYAAFSNERAVSISIEIPVLGPSLKALIDQQSFSFAQFWRTTPGLLPAGLDVQLRAWMNRVFRQFREVELWLLCEEILSSLK